MRNLSSTCTRIVTFKASIVPFTYSLLLPFTVARAFFILPSSVLPFLIPLFPHVRFSHSSFLYPPMSGSPIPHSSIPPCQVLPFLIPLSPHVRFSHSSFLYSPMSGSPIPHSSIPPCQVLPFLIPLSPHVRFSHSSFLYSPMSGSPIPHSSVPPCQVLPPPVEQKSCLHNARSPPPTLALSTHHGNPSVT